MPIGKAAQISVQNHWAIALFALGLYFCTVGCTPQPIEQSNSNPSLSSIPPTPLQTSTSIPTTQPAPTPSSTPQADTPTSPIRTETPGTVEVQTTPFVPIRGNADKIAFIDGNEIWMANLDGSGLTQLTNDGSPKSNPRWSHDVDELIYLSGLCAKIIDIRTLQISTLACFQDADRLDAFELSPDGEQVAVSLDRQLFVVPFDKVRLSQAKSGADLGALVSCESLRPYKHRQSVVTVSNVKWSADGDRLAIVRQGFDSGRQVELIHILDLSTCISPLPRLDEFPATRFEMRDYEKTPVIQNFGWDGRDLFALTSYRHNDGFGDLWIYNTSIHRGFLANPIQGKCCYRDPVFSPDGKYLAFAFQDARSAPGGPVSMYYIPYEAIDSSLVYPPILLPADFFSELRSKPQPNLRLAP